MKTLRLILGDQLNQKHSWYAKDDSNCIYLMAEMRQETDYVKHHIQKIVAFFLSMRSFSDWLQSKNKNVIYLEINDPENEHDLEKIIQKAIEENAIEKFEYQLPDEYRLDEQLRKISNSLAIPVETYDTEHFFTQRNYLENYFEGKKQLLMEYFYRDMRKEFGYLMKQGNPLGNEWNFDAKNRERYDKKTNVPKALSFTKNVKQLVEEINEAGVSHFGDIDEEHFEWPTSREECWKQLQFFNEKLLENFGRFEDAMDSKERNLFHSRLSFALNSKMLSPKEVLDFSVDYYHQNSTKISLSSIEGFVRQILGWREYIRGIYWMHMPKYATLNELDNQYELPQMYWTGKTKMNCLSQALTQSLEDAYAHHILRLMVIGNFSLLTFRNPDSVDAWYLGVYIDAIEWVEMPNTRGMSQYADGGIVATKPYVSSGNYINKMSDFCKKCHYNVKEKTTENACPFNSLYWSFLDEKKDYFNNNPRMGMMLNLLKKISPEELHDIKKRAARIIENPDNF